METFEDLGAAIGTVSHDTEALIGRAVIEGRRQQRRRRIGAGVGAGVGVVAVGAAVVGSGLLSAGSPSADGTAFADRTTETVTTTDGGQTGPAGDGRVDLPTAGLTDARLTARLPVPGTVVSATDDKGGVSVSRIIDPDGSGNGSVDLYLTAEPALSQTQISGADHKCRLVSQATGAESCKPLADGWMFTWKSHPDLENAAPQALDWSATVVREDGTSVSVHATNYVHASDPTRGTPVLGAEKIEALATDLVWFQPAS